MIYLFCLKRRYSDALRSFSDPYSWICLFVYMFIWICLLVLVFGLQWLNFHREILIMLLPQFSLTFFSSHNLRLFSCYSRADWDGICGYLRDVLIGGSL